MAERRCRVCQSPIEPGASNCANCGTAVERPPTGVGARGQGARGLLFVVFAVATLGVAAAVALSGAKDEPDPREPPSATGEPLAAAAEPPAPAEVPDPAEAVHPAPVDSGPSGSEPAPAPSVESATLRFAARVATARGKALAKGAKCVINVHVTGAHVRNLDASCGETLLYDSRTPLNGMSSHGSALFERAKGDTWVYRVLYSDTGMRTSRSQLRLSTVGRQTTAFSDGAEPFSVELRVDEFSEPRSGASLLDTPRDTPALALSLRKVSEEGPAPGAAGACRLSSEFVEGAPDGPRCKTELRCGSTILYGKGQQGFGSCQIRAQGIVSVEDSKETHEDGDPWLRVALAEGKVELRDSPAQQAYALSFEVEATAKASAAP